jgi:hypothetical protein
MTDFNIDSLTPDQINNIKLSGGFSGSLQHGIELDAGASSFTPRTSTPISGHGKELRPRVAGNDPTKGLVTLPDIGKYNHEDQRRQETARAAAEARRQEIEALQAVTDPKKLQASLQALSRKVNKLEKQLSACLETFAKNS